MNKKHKKQTYFKYRDLIIQFGSEVDFDLDRNGQPIPFFYEDKKPTNMTPEIRKLNGTKLSGTYKADISKDLVDSRFSGDYIAVMFWTETVSRNYTRAASRSWTVDDPSIKNLNKINGLVVHAMVDMGGTVAAFAEAGSILFNINKSAWGRVSIETSCDPQTDTKLVDKFLLALKKNIGGSVVSNAKKRNVEIGFCSNSQFDSYELKKRKISVPFWEDIRDNYSDHTRNNLDSFMKDFKPSTQGGQLMIWHGKPGSGKTYALRSLIAEWQTWCKIFYVTDPEVFFTSSSYMLGVVSETAGEDRPDEDDEDFNAKESDDNIPWRLLVMEDAGDLITQDASIRTGSNALARFLNLVDGLIGQGMKTIVLITSNEPLSKLHPAVSRSGRSSSIIDFKYFSKEEANAWLKSKSSDKTVDRETSLADLFVAWKGNSLAKDVPEHRSLGLFPAAAL